MPAWSFKARGQLFQGFWEWAVLSAQALPAPSLTWQEDFLATKPHGHCHHPYAGHLHLQQWPRPLAAGRPLSLPFDPPCR